MIPKINFTPGPSQLFFTVKDHVRNAFRNGIPSLSHRSKDFEGIYTETTEGLKTLLNIPDNFHTIFCGSANEIWERIGQNLIEDNSHHFVNGAFSKRFHEIVEQLGKHPTKTDADLGKGFATNQTIPSSEVIALTHNETSTGVSLPLDFIHSFKDKFPNALVVVDAVSSLPYPDFDYSKIDSVFFSVQKGFGLPAGLGVWIVNDKCVAKAESLLTKGISIGSYHNLPTLIEFAKKNQTPETPNVLGIYLLSKVIQDFLRRGIQTIRRETDYKAAILYNALSSHSCIKALVQDDTSKSKTVVVADCGSYTEKLTTFLLSKGMQPGDGYGSFKKSHLRFANFPAHSKEQFELLVDTISEFKA